MNSRSDRQTIHRGVWTLCIAAALLSGCVKPDDNANRLFVEASQLVRDGQELEKKSFTRALALYLRSQEKLREIPARFPSSEMAVKLVQGQLRVGSYTVSEFEDIVLTQARMKAKAEADPLSCALLVSDRVTDPSSRAKLLIDIAKIHLQKKNADFGAELLMRALGTANSINDTSLKSGIIADISMMFAQSGNYEKALAVTNSIEGPSDKTGALTAIADAYGKIGQGEKAAEILFRSLVTASTIKDPSFKYGALIDIARAYAAIGRFEPAMQVVKIIDNPAERTTAYFAIARAHVRQGSPDKCSEILSKAFVAASMIKDPARRGLALSEIAKIYNEISRFDQSQMIAKIVSDPAMQTSLLGEIAGCLYKNGDGVRAEDMLDQAVQGVAAVSDPEAKVKLLSFLAHQCLQGGESDRAVELIHQAYAVVLIINDPVVKANLLTDIAGLYRESPLSGKTSDILGQAMQEVSGAVKDPYGRIQLLEKIGDLYRVIGKNDKAAQIFAEEVQVANGLTDPSHRVSVYLEIAARYDEMELKKELLGVISEALRAAALMNDYSYKTRTLVDIGERYAQKDMPVNDDSRAVLHDIICGL